MVLDRMGNRVERVNFHWERMENPRAMAKSHQPPETMTYPSPLRNASRIRRQAVVGDKRKRNNDRRALAL